MTTNVNFANLFKRLHQNWFVCTQVIVSSCEINHKFTQNTGAVFILHIDSKLDKKTHISGALIGGVLLATITSMPEFITSITSTVALNEPSLAFGNVFGSNIFNIVILALADLIFLKHMFFNKVKTQRTTNALVILMYIIFMIPLMLSGFTGLDYGSFTLNILLTFNVISFLIIIVYVFSIRAMNNDETEQSEEVSNLSYKHIGLMI